VPLAPLEVLKDDCFHCLESENEDAVCSALKVNVPRLCSKSIWVGWWQI
jgi:hypothetical protein